MCFSFRSFLMSRIMLTSSCTPSYQNNESWIKDRCYFCIGAYVFPFLIAALEKRYVLWGGGYNLKNKSCGKRCNYLVILKDRPGGVPLTQALQIDNATMNFCSKERFYISHILNITNAKWNQRRNKTQYICFQSKLTLEAYQGRI